MIHAAPSNRSSVRLAGTCGRSASGSTGRWRNRRSSQLWPMTHGPSGTGHGPVRGVAERAPLGPGVAQRVRRPHRRRPPAATSSSGWRASARRGGRSAGGRRRRWRRRARPRARRRAPGQAQRADLHREVVVLGLEAERAGHAAAAGVELDRRRRPGCARSSSPWPRCRSPPSRGSGRAARSAVRRAASPRAAQVAVVDRLEQQVGDQVAPGRRRLRARASSGSRSRYSSRRVSRHDGSQPTIGTPRAASGASRVDRRARHRARAWSSRPLERLEPPAAPAALQRARASPRARAARGRAGRRRAR